MINGSRMLIPTAPVGVISMEIKFSNCVDDYIAWHKYLSKNDRSYRKKSLIPFVVMFLVIQSIFFNIFMLHLYFNIDLSLFWLLVISFNIVFLFDYINTFTRTVKLTLSKSAKKKPNFIECEKSVKIAPDKVYYMFGAREGNVPWRLIDDVVKLNESIVIKEENFKFIIPLRFFSDIEEFNKFYDESKSYWENNREETKTKPHKRIRIKITKRKIIICSFIALFVVCYILLLTIANPHLKAAEKLWASSFKEGNLEDTYNHSTLDFKNRISFEQWSDMIMEYKNNNGLFQDYETINFDSLSNVNQISHDKDIIKSVIKGENGIVFIRTIIKRENGNYLLDGFDIVSPSINKLSYMSESDQEKSKPYDWSSDDFDFH